MASDYSVQVVHHDGSVVASWPPRSRKLHGHDESQGIFIDALCDRLKAKGVGVGATAEHVCTDLRAVWQDLLHELKGHV